MALQLTAGGVFTLLLLLLPAAHAAKWLDVSVGPVGWALAGLPLVMLLVVATSRRPRSPTWSLTLFPCSHLPALVFTPELASPAVYEGYGGLWAIVAIAVAGAVWMGAACWRPGVRAGGGAPTPATSPPQEGRDGRALVVISWVLALAVYWSLLVPVFGHDDADAAALNVAAVGGLLATWYVVGYLVVERLGDVVLDERERRRFRAAVMLPPRPNRRTLVIVLATAGMTTALVLLWYVASG